MIREWRRAEIQEFGYRVVDVIARHLSELPGGPVFRPVPTGVRQALAGATPPEEGLEPLEVLRRFEEQIEPYPLGNGHPRFFGWVNSPPVVIGVFAEALAAAMNSSCAGGNHAATYVEQESIGWLKRLVGFPESSMGLLLSGGSMATLTALAVARHAALGDAVRTDGLGRLSLPPVVYRTSEGHACIQKAVELLGLGTRCLRTIAHDPGHRMIPAALDAALAADRSAGMLPMAVVASAGTVSTGAIDPLDEIADVCERHRVWLHVDGSYGAPALLTARYHDQLRGMSRGDSVAVDPHKWLSIPVDAGAVLVRNAEAMRAAFSLVPAYLRTDGGPGGVGGPPWWSEYGFEQTRPFRALKLWMAQQQYGRAGYRNAIERDLSHADRLADRVRQRPELELRTSRSLSIVCFRYAPERLHADRPRLDRINEALMARLQRDGRAFLTGTVVDGVFWLRACFVNYRTSADDVDAVAPLVATLGAEVAASHVP